jgi:hypothetical protein
MIAKITIFVVSVYFLMSAVLFSSEASAVFIGFNRDTSFINVGQPVDIYVEISGLSPGVHLGAFDFNVNFDTATLNFEGYVLEEHLGIVGNGEALDTSSAYIIGGNVINLAELSLLADLSFQLDSFTLATLTFTGKNPGVSSLWLSDIILSDGNANKLNVDGSNPATVNVVPIPGSIWLAASGLIGFAALKRRIAGCL